jgi:hypothetical protein
MCVWSGNFQGHVCAGRIVMIYLLSLHKIMFYFIFVHNYIWILDKAFNIDFCLLNFVHVLLYTIRQNSVWTMHGRVNRPAHTWPWKFPLQTNIVRHDEKSNRAIAIDHVTLNMLKLVVLYKLYCIWYQLTHA